MFKHMGASLTQTTQMETTNNIHHSSVTVTEMHEVGLGSQLDQIGFTRGNPGFKLCVFTTP